VRELERGREKEGKGDLAEKARKYWKLDFGNGEE
jgi:hypothetical protein